MKKLLLTLGTVAAVAAPVASVIACGSNDSDAYKQANDEQKLALNTLGQIIGNEVYGISASGETEPTITSIEVSGNNVKFAYKGTGATTKMLTRRAFVDLDGEKITKVELSTEGQDFITDPLANVDELTTKFEIDITKASNDFEAIAKKDTTLKGQTVTITDLFSQKASDAEVTKMKAQGFKTITGVTQTSTHTELTLVIEGKSDTDEDKTVTRKISVSPAGTVTSIEFTVKDGATAPETFTDATATPAQKLEIPADTEYSPILSGVVASVTIPKGLPGDDAASVQFYSNLLRAAGNPEVVKFIDGEIKVTSSVDTVTMIDIQHMAADLAATVEDTESGTPGSTNYKKVLGNHLIEFKAVLVAVQQATA